MVTQRDTVRTHIKNLYARLARRAIRTPHADAETN